MQWTLTNQLLARLDFQLAGANWQRSGGKGTKPKPIDVPGGKSKADRAASPARGDVVDRLRNLGFIPPGS